MSRLIVITGAGSGIGKATAERFAVAGDKLILVGRRPEVLDRAADDLRARVDGADLAVVSADLSDLPGAVRLQEHIADLGLPVAGLVCCAGSAPSAGDGGLKAVAEEWHEAYRANVMTAALTVEGLESALAENGSVVLYSSIAAYRGSGGSGAYGAAKNALHSYAHTLATRLGPRGVNVNVIAPGYVAETEFFSGRLTAAREALLIKQTALGRAGSPQDIANLAFFLCSAEGAYLTSQVIQVNGGSSHGV